MKESFNDCAIITITPQKKILTKLREISEDLLDIDENQLDSLLDTELLETHTVPVCIPLQNSPEALSQFLTKNSALLLNYMLTAWPFPLKQWGFTNKNSDLLLEYLNIKYYPILCKALTKPSQTTLDLAVTLATPTVNLVEDIAEKIASKKMTLSEEELTQLEFRLASGICIITDTLQKKEQESIQEFFTRLNDSSNYLYSLKENQLKTLFYFYFRDPQNFPEENTNEFLNKWFDTKTYLGLYLFDEGLAKKYSHAA